MENVILINHQKVAYFSMEIALEDSLPTYAGGLGVLAGDTVRAAADLGVPMVAVTLLHRKGYFRQKLTQGGDQIEEADGWQVEDFCQEMSPHVQIDVEGRSVFVRAWRYTVEGIHHSKLDVYLLDTDLAVNSKKDRELCDYLYGGDSYYRFCQEMILGIAGVRMLNALGYHSITVYHMNEGHSSLLTLELLQQYIRLRGKGSFDREDLEAIHKKCVFTTHTPVAAGHDQFPMEMVHKILGKYCFQDKEKIFCQGNTLNLTYLGMTMSRFINGVAKRHGEVAQDLFSHYKIDSITNGVHAPSWVGPAMSALFDQYIPLWREDYFSLRYALSISLEEIWQAHLQQKRTLLEKVKSLTGETFDENALTIGFARRATAYKRHDMIFHDLERLKQIVMNNGPLQLIFSGKAHPHDISGKKLIKSVFHAAQNLKEVIKVVYLEDYDISLAKILVSGVDVWLNNPEPPLEASGTSGMKAALNGIPSLSILDGWWIEGCIEGVTGWSIGENHKSNSQLVEYSKDANSLYDQLENKVMPSFYQDRTKFMAIMRSAIALNGSFFNTHRMIQQYVQKAYFR
ncbi:MAG: alpha-glucan family phosphorylase [Oligoflexus sp.]